MDGDLDPQSGRWTERDPDTGQIVKAGLSPEKAAEMARSRHTRAERVEADTNALLAEMGYDNPAEADASTVLMARRAAEGSIEGIRLLLAQNDKLKRTSGKSAGNWKGEGICPTCGHNHAATMRLTDGAALRIAAIYADEARKQYEQLRDQLAAGQSVELIFAG